MEASKAYPSIQCYKCLYPTLPGFKCCGRNGCKNLNRFRILKLLDDPDSVTHLKRFIQIAKTPDEERTIDDFIYIDNEKYIQALFTRNAINFTIEHYNLLLEAIQYVPSFYKAEDVEEN